jgi:hypothetical protein
MLSLSKTRNAFLHSILDSYDPTNINSAEIGKLGLIGR